METKLKFKIGDKVRVKSLEWYNANKDVNGKVENYKEEIFIEDMAEYCGKVLKITAMLSDYYITDGNIYCWQDWMLEEEAVTDEKQEVEQLNKNTMETKEMTKQEVFAFLKDSKIICTSTQESTKVQKKLFELGIGWTILGTSVANKYLLFINDDRLEFTPDIDFWVRSDKKRIEPSEILAIEIKEQTPKFDPKTLQPFDKVLVRDGEDCLWRCNFFSHIREDKDYTFDCIANYWKCCIPYNEDTKHLVGTTKDAPEFYRI